MTSTSPQRVERSQACITVQHPTDAVVLTLAGELDIATVAELKNAVDLVVSNETLTALHIDVVQVTFADSFGVRSLLQARHAAVTHGLVFALRTEPGGEVERIITVSGLDDKLADYTPQPTQSRG